MIGIVSPDVERYAEEHTTGEAPYFAAIAEATRQETAAPQMMTGRIEGRFLAMLVHLLQPQLVVDVGTFTGYSALSMAEALPPGGRVITCDLNEEHIALARKHFEASPYRDRIELRVGPALDTLATIDEPIDFAFIDADKTNYANYYDVLLPKLTERGAIAVDNVLWSGQVLDPEDKSESTEAIRAFNDKVRDDPRVQCVMTTIRDGVTLIRKR